jgi:hypothetical protein
MEQSFAPGVRLKLRLQYPQRKKVPTTYPRCSFAGASPNTGDIVVQRFRISLCRRPTVPLRVPASVESNEWLLQRLLTCGRLYVRRHRLPAANTR